jgi:cell division septum initiation protein DivIVA
MDIQQRYENLLSENKKLITEIDRLRQQLASQPSVISKEAFETIGYLISMASLYDEMLAKHHAGKLDTLLRVKESPSVEVLLEALQLAKVTFIANKMDVRNVMEVIDEALSSYKPT